MKGRFLGISKTNDKGIPYKKFSKCGIWFELQDELLPVYITVDLLRSFIPPGEVWTDQLLDQTVNGARDQADLYPADSRDIIVSGQLERTMAMTERYSSFRSMVDPHGIDFQIFDKHNKLKVQCQTDSLCKFKNYKLTFFTSDFEFSLCGWVEENFARSFRLPQRFIEQKVWNYKIALSM